jgi:hypothetical protein
MMRSALQIKLAPETIANGLKFSGGFGWLLHSARSWLRVDGFSAPGSVAPSRQSGAAGPCFPRLVSPRQRECRNPLNDFSLSASREDGACDADQTGGDGDSDACNRKPFTFRKLQIGFPYRATKLSHPMAAMASAIPTVLKGAKASMLLGCSPFLSRRWQHDRASCWNCRKSSVATVATGRRVRGPTFMRYAHSEAEAMSDLGTKISAIFRRRLADLPEPAWGEVLVSPDERHAAAHYWRGIAAAMRDAGTLKAVNNHAMLRLVTAYLIFDRVSAVNMRGGQIDVQAWSIHQAASQIASQIESDLGLSPRRRAT